MEYISTKEASKKWGISPIRITLLANEGRIPGAYRLGKSWLIPATATKPERKKANRSNSTKKEPENFSFPLYHFRPDWNYIKDTQLSEQQQNLLLAETAVMECRFVDAFAILEPIQQTPDDIVTEIGCLWNYGICCIALNKPEDFSKAFLRLQMLLAADFPHRDDLAIILDCLKTYVQSINSAASIEIFNTDIHEQSLPLTCVLVGYTQLTKEAIKPGRGNILPLELSLRFLQNTGATIVMEMIHIYLLIIYSIRQDTEKIEKHAKTVVQIAYENKLYFPLVTYHRYTSMILEPIIHHYPKDFRNHLHKLISEYETNSTSFFSSINEDSVVSKLTDEDYPYIYAVIMGLTNTVIAEQMGIHTQTVKRRLLKICEKLGVGTKKELKTYLYNHM